MITLTRLNGAAFAVNPDLIERAEMTPDTVLTLVGGTKYVIAETVEELIDRVRRYRASIIALSEQLDPTPRPERSLHVVPLPTPEI